MTSEQCESRECPVRPTQHITRRDGPGEWWACDPHCRALVARTEGFVFVEQIVRDKDWP